MKRRLLLISSNYANGGVIHKYVKNFAEAIKDDNHIIIATHSTRIEAPEGCEIITSPYISTRLYEHLRFRLFGTFDTAVPDLMRYTVSPFLYRKLSHYIKTNSVDAIHSFSFACSTHLVAYRLKKEFGIPWIAHFMDAWIGNPYRNIKANDRNQDAEYEKQVALNADIIVHTNRVIADQWIRRYGAVVEKKISVLPLGYSKCDLSEFIKLPPYRFNKETITITYIGTCAGDRNLQTLIKAIALVKEKRTVPVNKLQVRILGNMLPVDEQLVNELSLSEIIRFVGRKTGEDLKCEYENADIFFVVDAPMEENIFFPSKLLDYFKYKKPILGISPQIGVTNQFLKESGNYCFDNSDIEGVAGYLEKVLSNTDFIFQYDKDYYKHFLPDEIACKYREVLRSIGL